ncbi:MAG: tRNA (adenosine(37)-N6)-threonylcarbamoyltransferase complex dimerization subunit type 1 TsaB [Candidatus Cryptobacteroides sp.]
MERIILIETSTALCSCAIAQDGEIVAYRESSAPKSHASLTAVFVQEMLDSLGTKLSDCDAVCVSMGPGSYTGLRVGVSTAKGLCFGAKKPLLAAGTLDTLVAKAENPGNYDYIVPMVDARRMEVYSAVYRNDGTRITDVAPAIIDGNSFSEYLADSKVLFIGDGAGKCEGTIVSPNASFIQCCPDARAMLRPALKEFHAGNFQDVAYFEPFYLKEFVATTSKKKLL